MFADDIVLGRQSNEETDRLCPNLPNSCEDLQSLKGNCIVYKLISKF